MAKPVILSLDDDIDVSNAIVRDLRRQYGKYYRIIRANDGHTALDALRELEKRNDTVALFLVDQRMPEMTGVEFLRQAIPLFPDARRVLLTAYSDTEAAIQAINDVGINQYLLKPWDPPEENLYPVLNDLLLDWQAGYRPEFMGIRIIGHRWSPQTHEIKEFLARNQIPYKYLDVETDERASVLTRQLELTVEQMPCVLMPEGEMLSAPTRDELVERMGLPVQADKPFYDLVVVGGGPAGLAAAVYGASEGLSTLLVEREATGGQAGTSSRIENYLGFPSGLSGADLARRATAQAKRFGVEILTPQSATSMRVQDTYRVVTLSNGDEVTCHALIVAVGLSYAKLEAPGVEPLTGAGVYYGASTSEALSCQMEPVFIIGAGNSAGQAAVYLANYASKVYMLVRGNSLADKMSEYLSTRIEGIANIEVRTNTVLEEAHGTDRLEGVTILNRRTEERETLPATGLFIFIGAYPQTGWLGDTVARDERGFVLAGADMLRDPEIRASWKLDRPPFLLESSVPGVFAVGDVRANSVKRVASAVGEGSIAVQFVHQYMSEGK